MRIGGRCHRPPPPADGGAGADGGLQRRPAVNADLDPSSPSLWPLFVLPALAAGFGGLDDAGRNAIVPNLVRRSEVPTANAIFQAALARLLPGFRRQRTPETSVHQAKVNGTSPAEGT